MSTAAARKTADLTRKQGNKQENKQEVHFPVFFPSFSISFWMFKVFILTKTKS